ncbi:MAG: regulatory protein RecX [Bdellovibrionales bacterium]
MFKRPPRTAYNVMIDLLSRRNHSERELRRKLKEKDFSTEDIQAALDKAHELKWLETPDNLSVQFADQLHRKNKGIHFINSTLAEKGLPPIERDEALELDKARKLVKTKYSDFSRYSRSELAKVGRFLASRGFDLSIVRKVIFNHEEEL